MNVFIGIVLVLILMVLSGILTAIKEKPKSDNSKIQVPKIIPANEVYTKAFKEGTNNNWAVVQTILYKLYIEDCLLDFDSLNEKIKENMRAFEKDKNSLIEWNVRYVAYVNEKKEERK